MYFVHKEHLKYTIYQRDLVDFAGLGHNQNDKGSRLTSTYQNCPTINVITIYFKLFFPHKCSVFSATRNQLKKNLDLILHMQGMVHNTIFILFFFLWGGVYDFFSRKINYMVGVSGFNNICVHYEIWNNNFGFCFVQKYFRGVMLYTNIIECLGFHITQNIFRNIKRNWQQPTCTCPINPSETLIPTM